MKSRKKLSILISVVILVAILATILVPTVSATYESSPFITLFDNELNTDYSKFFSSAITQRLPEGIEDDEAISLIIQTKHKTLLDAYDASGSELSFADYCLTEEATKLLKEMEMEDSQ
jgi:hypothetical protein